MFYNMGGMPSKGGSFGTPQQRMSPFGAYGQQGRTPAFGGMPSKGGSATQTQMSPQVMPPTYNTPTPGMSPKGGYTASPMAMMGMSQPAPQPVAQPASPFANVAEYTALQDFQRSLMPTQEQLDKLNSLRTAFQNTDAYKGYRPQNMYGGIGAFNFYR